MHYLFMFVCENTHHSNALQKPLRNCFASFVDFENARMRFDCKYWTKPSIFSIEYFFLVMKLNINKNERISMKFNGIRWCLTCFNKKKSNENRMENFSSRKMLQTKNSQYLHQNQITRAMKWFAWKITRIFPSVC